jgi:Ca-activated chloride channel homolog
VRGRAALLAAAWVLLCGASYTAHREVQAGNEALAAGDPKAAIGHYERAGKADPKEPAIPYDLGTARLAAGDVDGAVEALGAAAGEPGAPQITAPDPVRARAAFNLGNAHLERAKGPTARADLQAAIDAYRRAVAADPQDAAARRNLQIAATRLARLPPPQPQPQSQQQQNQPDQSKPGGQQRPAQASNSQGGASQAQPPQDNGQPSQDDQKATPAPSEKGGSGGEPQTEAKAEDQDHANGNAEGTGDEARKGELPEDVARALAALRRKEEGVMREAMRRAMGPPEAVEPDW